MANICEYGEHAKNWFEWFWILFRVWPDVFYVSRYVSICWFAICIQVSCRLSTVLCGLGCVDLRCMFGFPSDWAFTFASCRTSCKSNLLASDMPLSYTMLIWSTPTCLWMTWGLFFFSLFVVADLHPGPRLSVTCFWLTGCSTAIWWLSMERCPARSWTSRLLVQRSMFATARLVQRMGWQVWRYRLGMHWYVEDPISELHTLWKYTKSQGLLMFTVFSASLWNNGPFGRANSGTPKFQKKIRGISCISPLKTLGTQTRKKRRVSGKTRGFWQKPQVFQTSTKIY